MTPAPRDLGLEGFHGALVAELFELDGYVELLAAERKAIDEGRADVLETLQPDKTVRLNALREHGTRRARFLAERGYRKGTPGMTDLLEANPGLEASIGRAWQALRSKAWEADHLTRLNAALAATHLEHFRARLGALLGAAPGAARVYGGDGALSALRPGPRWRTAG